MRQLRAVLGDRRRSQRGSVLSGVLIMTALIAIIAGALMTELSTNFIISTDLQRKFANQATMSSAVESAINQLQSTPLNSGCPAPNAVPLNNTWAVPTYASCWPTVDARWPGSFRLSTASDSPFNVDGIHSSASGDYVVGNASGTVFDYPFGSGSARWTLQTGGSVTGPTMVMANPGRGGYIDAIPLSGSRCAPASYCVGVWTDAGAYQTPVLQCVIPTVSATTTQPFASPNAGMPGLAYYANGTGIESNDLRAFGGNCDLEASATQSGSRPVTAGPIAFCANCRSGTDYVVDVVSDSGTSILNEYTGGNGLTKNASITLPWGGAVGMAASTTSLPATLAITFRQGGVALVTISATGALSLGPTTTLGIAVAGAPYWCPQCGTLLLGIGAQDGSLHLLDPQLNAYATSAGTGAAASTTPGADGAGDWYIATAPDGLVRELQLQSGQLTQVKTYGPLAQPGTSVQVGACPAGICIYMGGLDGSTYLVPLDARDVVINTCISTGSTGCSGANPRLNARLEVGATGDKQMVHVQGWSYYSG